MIEITKDEAMAIREKYGSGVGITITNRRKKSSRKRYYTEESGKVLYFLRKFRGELNSAGKKRLQG